MAEALENQVADALGSVDALVRSEAFQSKSSNFVQGHCKTFEFTDENKLEYTDVFNKYQDMIEAFLLDNLNQTDLELLLENLGVAMKSNAVKVTPSLAQTLDLLSSLGDFELFKDMMLATRRDIESGSETKESLTGAIRAKACTTYGVEAYDQLFNEVAAASGSTDGWNKITDKKWMTIETKSLGGKVFNRLAFQTDLLPEEALDAMRFDNPRMVEWWAMFDRHEILKVYGPGDSAVRTYPKLGFSKIMSSFVPEYIDLRVIVRENFPEKGSMSIGQLGWDVASDTVKAHSIFKVRITTITPVLGDATKSNIVVVDETNPSWIPSWVRNTVFSSVAPKMFGSLAVKYKSAHA